MSASDLAAQIAALPPERRAALEGLLVAAPAGRVVPQPSGTADADPGHAPLTPVQERIWLLAQKDPGNPAYHRLLALRLRGPLVRDALAAALTQLCARHSTLRGGYLVADGKLVHRPTPPAPVDLVDLAPPAVGPDELGAEFDEALDEAFGAALDEVATEFNRAPFDLAVGPPIRFGLLQLAEDTRILLISCHHLACDGWSDGILIRDLAALYEAALSSDPTPPLPALPITFDELARRRRAEEPDAAARSVEYWRRQLAPPLPAPGTPGPRSGRGAVRRIRVSDGLVQQVADFARERGVTRPRSGWPPSPRRCRSRTAWTCS